MVADGHDLGEDDAPRVAPLMLIYGGLWFVLTLLLGSLAISGQFRQLEEEFYLQAAAVEANVSATLQASEAALAGLVVFAGIGGAGAEQGLERYAEQIIARFPHINRIIVLYRDEARVIVPSEREAADRRAVAYMGEIARRASAADRAMLSHPLQWSDGEAGYGLSHSVPVATESPSGPTAVSLLIRLRDLWPSQAPWPGLDIALQSLPAADAAAAAADTGGNGLFPVLRLERELRLADQPLQLVVERRPGWEALPPSFLAVSAVTMAVGLWLALAYAGSCARERANSQRAARRLHHLANYDGLTALPNRNLLCDRLRQALSRARRQQFKVAVLFLDLNGFKAVNDSAGHQAGDRLLIEVAQRLQQCVREQDTVGRLSGDEFVIVLEGISDRADAERVVEQLCQRLALPVTIDRRELQISASVGIALYPEDGEADDELLRKADQAMYRMKQPASAA